MFVKDIDINSRHDKDLKKTIKKFKYVQVKALSLNLDDYNLIKQCCNAQDIDERYLKEIAQVIKEYNHE